MAQNWLTFEGSVFIHRQMQTGIHLSECPLRFVQKSHLFSPHLEEVHRSLKLFERTVNY